MSKARRFYVPLLVFAAVSAGAALLCFSQSAYSRIAGNWFTVKHVSDGDTIYLSKSRALRYIGIDAPEIAHERKRAAPLGNAAARFNSSLVLNKRVRIELGRDERDSYDRMLAYVFLENGDFVNGLMVSKGLAWCLYSPPNISRFDELLSLQRQAMEENAGVWADWPQKSPLCVGNSRSKRFHLVGCQSLKKTRKTNRVVFPSMREAFRSGYAPCKRCLGDWQRRLKR